MWSWNFRLHCTRTRKEWLCSSSYDTVTPCWVVHLTHVLVDFLLFLLTSVLLTLEIQAIDDPSSNQFRDPPTYTHQPSMQQKVPFSLIRCSSSKVAFCSCVEWGWHIYNIVESESDPLTRRAIDLFEKEPLKGNSEVHLHTPTKFGEDRSKDLGGDREQTDRQTNRQTLLDL